MIEILAIQNNDKLLCEKEKLTISNELKIKNIEIVEELKEIENSTTPIINVHISDSNKKFQESLDSLLKSISNKYLYENYIGIQNGTTMYSDNENKEEKEKEINLQLNTLLSKLDLNKEILRKLFLTGKGTFEDYGVIKYNITNVNNHEESIYTVDFVNNNKLVSFKFTYNRLLNKITNIEEV